LRGHFYHDEHIQSPTGSPAPGTPPAEGFGVLHNLQRMTDASFSKVHDAHVHCAAAVVAGVNAAKAAASDAPAALPPDI
jgi:hypothetical protein